MSAPKDHVPKTQDSFSVNLKPRIAVADVRTNERDASALTAAPAINTPSPSHDQRSTLADSDSSYQRIDADTLPSKGLFYEFTALSIRKFHIPELKKVYRARTTSSFRTLVEAIQSTIDRDLFQMTIGDFWYLMYWHRINSYLSAPLEISFTCTDEQHNKKVKDGKLDKETLEGRVTLNKTTLRPQYIEDAEAVSEIIAKVFHDYEGITLCPTRVIDLIENTSMMDTLGGVEAIAEELANTNPGPNGDSPVVAVTVAKKIAEHLDEEWLNDYVGLLHPTHGDTLEKKREFLMVTSATKAYGFELLQDMDTFNALTAHGVEEYVTTQCKGCGAKAEGKISASALDFFPAI